MDQLTYPKERVLNHITLIIGAAIWALTLTLISLRLYSTLPFSPAGNALFITFVYGYLAGAGYLGSLFAHSAFISHLKGSGVAINARQFPDLHEQFIECCKTLKIDKHPEVYILNGNGIMNAFATRFLRRQYVVLMSDVVDSMHENPDGTRFYLGHELGHLRMRHLSKTLLRFPAMLVPLLGSAYSRARESTCDRHGKACCQSVENAARSLVALAAGRKRWQSLDLDAYSEQLRNTSGVWMSFHELISGYPWLSKRVARVMDQENRIPGRSPLAYIMGMSVPSGGMGSIILIILLFYTGMFIANIGSVVSVFMQHAHQTAATLTHQHSITTGHNTFDED